MSRVILLDTEDGANSVADLIREGKVIRYDCRTFENLEKVYWALQMGQIKGDLVVLDTADTVVQRFVMDCTMDPKDINPLVGKTIWAQRDRTRQNQDIWNRVNYGARYVFTGIRELPMPTMFLIHAVDRSDPMAEGNDPNADAKTGEVFRVMPALPPKILLNVLGGSDMIFRMFKTPTITQWEGKNYPVNTRVMQLENTPDAFTGERLTPLESAALPRYIYEPTIAKLVAAIGYMPKKSTVYSYPKVGKTVFGCTLPN